ncbi:MAG: type IV pilus assembly protein PilM [Patescibacteria group bacterium]|nr:type IV pilus assembly protein PilM [Patescibacteria group bacterium]
MSVLGSSALSYLGVDIGSSSIKIVELKRIQNKVALVSYGFSDKLSAVYSDANRLDIKNITSIIENIFRKANFSSSRNVIASLPTFSVFSSIINISGKLNDKDLDSSIIWEAKKVIPLPLQDIVLDWQKIREKPAQMATVLKDVNPKDGIKLLDNKETSGQKILLIGAPKNLIKSYAFTFKSMNFNLVSLETEIFGLIRSLVGSDQSVSMIVQIGASSSNIFIVDKGVPVLSRSIDVGGLAITKAIAKNLQLDLEKAEQFKYDLAGHSDGQLPKMIIDTMAPVFNEIKYIVDVYSRKEANEVKKLILTGGSAMLYGLSDYLASLLNINVVVGDPWFRTSYPVELKPILDQIGPRMAVAIGLAMREYDKE